VICAGLNLRQLEPTSTHEFVQLSPLRFHGVHCGLQTPARTLAAVSRPVGQSALQALGAHSDGAGFTLRELDQALEVGGMVLRVPHLVAEISIIGGGGSLYSGGERGGVGVCLFDSSTKVRNLVGECYPPRLGVLFVACCS
jgi:hypothetical protein